MNNETIFEIIKLILTVITIIFAAFQVYFLKSEIKETQKWNTKNAAFNYCIHYSDIIKNIDKFDLSYMSKADVKKIFDKTTKKGKKNDKQVTYILQYFERLSVGILCDYFDEEIVRRILDRVFVDTYNKLEPFITLKREQMGKNVFYNYERVAKIWSKNKMKYPYRTTPSARTIHSNKKKK